MDAAAVSAALKELNQALGANKNEAAVEILKKLSTQVVPTEDLLRTTRAGLIVGKLRQNPDRGVSSLAKEVVKQWKEAIDENKRKRKREEEEKQERAERDKSDKDKDKDNKDKSDRDAKDDPPAKRSKSDAADSAAPSSASTPPDAEKDTKGPKVLSTIDTTRKTPRTAKTDGVVNSLHADKSEADGDPVRDKCVVMIYDALAGDSNAHTKVLSERAISIEREVFRMLNYSTGNDYRGKMRSLFLNLKDKGNPGLRNDIVLGTTSAQKVVTMTKEEMASESVRAKNQELAQENLFKSKAVGETRAETDAFKCSRCGQRKCTYYQMQTRSADEPMTTFVSCTVCGNKWKFS